MKHNQVYLNNFWNRMYTKKNEKLYLFWAKLKLLIIKQNNFDVIQYHSNTASKKQFNMQLYETKKKKQKSENVKLFKCIRNKLNLIFILQKQILNKWKTIPLLQ